MSRIVIIYDILPLYWIYDRERNQLSFDLWSKTTESLIHFISLLNFISIQNKVSLIGTSHSHCEWIFKEFDKQDYSKLKNIAIESLDKLNELSYTPTVTKLSHSLRKAITFINKMKNQDKEDIETRIIIILGSEDSPKQYRSIMNAIIASQKLNVIIDSCYLNDQDSSYLQQLSDLTKGIYLKVTDPNNLNYYLTSFYSIETKNRKILNIPGYKSYDYRAVCSCHEKFCRYGYICPKCVSFYCNSFEKCPICESSS